MRLSLIRSMYKMEWDFYIRLSDKKYIKVIHKGGQFGDEELAHYEKKKVKSLYLKSEDVKDFYSLLIGKIENLLKQGKGVSMKVQDLLNEVILRAVKEFGITDEAQKLTEVAVESAVKAIKSDTELSSLIDSFNLQEDSFINSHSAALSRMSCFFVSKLSWSSEIALKKLAMAAILHDVAVENDDLAKYADLNDIPSGEDGFTEEQIIDYKNHPIMATEIINSITSKSIPPDVANIVIQHHEKPDGTGFPKNLKARSIAPLSAVFIIAHRAIEQIIELGDEFSGRGFIERMKETHGHGVFGEVLKELAVNDTI